MLIAIFISRDLFTATTNKQSQFENQSSVLSSTSFTGQKPSSLKSSPNHNPVTQNIVKSNSSSKLQKLQDNDEQLIQFLNNGNSNIPVLINDNEVSYLFNKSFLLFYNYYSHYHFLTFFIYYSF